MTQPSPTRVWLQALERTAALAGPEAEILPLRLEAMADAAPSRPALLSADLALTYGALAGEVRKVARWAGRAGVRPGESVGLLMSGGPSYVALWLGLLRAGAVATLFPPGAPPEALAHGLRASGTRTLIAERRLLVERTRALADVSLWTIGPGAPAGEDFDGALRGLSGAPLDAGEEGRAGLGDVALQIFTSGTTGLPKAARISHRRLLAWSGWFSGLMGVGPEDRLYDCLPLHHSVGGVAAIGAMLVSGGSVFIRDGFSARAFWREVVAAECTLFQYIGELCRYLLAAPEDPLERRHALRLACGAGLRPEIWTPFKERFQIPRILEFYASTEGNFSLYNVEERVGALGRPPAFLGHRSPIALVEFDLEGEAPRRDAQGRCRRVSRGQAGEAIARIDAATPFEGYADAEATTRKILRDVFAPGDAWFRSGDLLRQDAEGFYYFVDRIGDTFRWKGENVSTAEVAAALLATGLVSDAVAYGVAAPAWDGRAGMAAVAPARGFDLAALHAGVAARLPAFARPKFLRLIPSVETTATFKPKKSALQAEGFDPDRIHDPLYVDLEAEGRYARLDAALAADIAHGRLRI